MPNAALLEVVPLTNAGSITSSLRGRMCSVSEFGTAYPPSLRQSGADSALHVVAKKNEYRGELRYFLNR
jgi:hypothetical protein